MMIDDLLSHVSHELRSPLTAVKRFATILLAGLAGELNPRQSSILQRCLLPDLMAARLDDAIQTHILSEAPTS
jgi:signal transduction histidine kinase